MLQRKDLRAETFSILEQLGAVFLKEDTGFWSLSSYIHSKIKIIRKYSYLMLQMKQLFMAVVWKRYLYNQTSFQVDSKTCHLQLCSIDSDIGCLNVDHHHLDSKRLATGGYAACDRI